MELEKARAELIAAGHYLQDNQLTWGNAGNLSVRTAKDRYLITASGTQLGDLHEDDFVEAGTNDGPQTGYPRKPSKELPMHRAVYEICPDMNAVVHASPFYTTLIACSTEKIPADLFVENMYYLERIARVPYFNPGSADLGEAVRAQVRAANVILLDNHGVLIYDTTIREALMGLQTLEFTCRMLIEARSAGLPLRSLTPHVVHGFLERSGYRPRRRWQL